jgi:CRISPR-associated protein Cas5d
VVDSKVSIRVWGDFACFTRPEMKVERVSYRVPTPSAARGVLEAIFWEPEMYYLIDSVTVLKPGKWFSFRRNEVKKVVSIDRAQRWMTGREPAEPIQAGGGADDAAQRNMLALAEVDYVFTAEVRLTDRGRAKGESVPKYVDQMMSRASKGKCGHRPSLGCREFAADFDLVTRMPDEVSGLTEPLGLMLYDVFDPAQRAAGTIVTPKPVFFQAEVTNGRMDCHPDRVTMVRPAPGRA